MVGAPGWRPVRQATHELAELRLKPERVGPCAAWVSSPSTLAELRHAMAGAFGVALDERVDVDAHRMGAGQVIGIHNDAAGIETHRLVLGLNDRWEDDDGGQLLLFGGPDPDDLQLLVAPSAGTALGFEISAASFHAVAEVRRGERLSVVYSFHASGPHKAL